MGSARADGEREPGGSLKGEAALPGGPRGKDARAAHGDCGGGHLCLGVLGARLGLPLVVCAPLQAAVTTTPELSSCCLSQARFSLTRTPLHDPLCVNKVHARQPRV